MNLLWRLIWVFIFSHFDKTADVFAETKTSFLTLPTDIDFFMHMNNGRYFSFMDAGRFNAIIRNKLYRVFRKNKVYGVVAGEMIRFRKSIGLFQRFTISTKLIGWDDNYFYIQHSFICNDELSAYGLVKLRCIQKDKTLVSPAFVLGLAGIQKEMPELPEYLKNWQLAEKAFAGELHQD